MNPIAAIRSLPNRILRRATRSNRTIELVLSEAVGEAHVARARLRNADSRLLLSDVAIETGIRESELCARAASLLGIEYLPRILPAEESELPDELGLADFRAAGAIPVTAGSGVAAVVCTCPGLVRALFGERRVPRLYLGTWRSIERALDLSVGREFRGGSSSPGEAGRSDSLSAARLVIDQVAREADRHGARSCEVRISEDGINYRFELPDGRTGRGTVSTEVAPQLERFVGTLGHVGSVFLRLSAETAVRARARLEEVSGTAIVTLDWSPPETSADSIRNSVESPPMPARVLVVEDNPTFSMVLERFLVREGFTVLVAGNGEAGMEILDRETNVDAVVCDVHMPRMDGTRFIREVRRQERFRALPVLMLTSDSDPEVELRFLTIGADLLLGKATDPRILISHLRRLVNRGARRAA